MKNITQLTSRPIGNVNIPADYSLSFDIEPLGLDKLHSIGVEEGIATSKIHDSAS
jgi:hypothetical protein